MTDARLFSVQRHERLLKQLRRTGAVRVRELARELGVSELTIRRDITALAARNLVTRVHGDIDEIFSEGMHEYLTTFLEDIGELGYRIQRAYLGAL